MKRFLIVVAVFSIGLFAFLSTLRWMMQSKKRLPIADGP